MGQSLAIAADTGRECVAAIAKAQGFNSGQPLPTRTKSRRTCAQQNAKISVPFFTWTIALYAL